MRRLVALVSLLLAVLLGHAARSTAQTAPTFETLTVSTTAVGLATATLSNSASYCLIAVETAAIRFRIDGMAPTSAVGTPLAAGAIIAFHNNADLRRLRFIRSGGSDGTVIATCASDDRFAGESVALGAAGGGGGAGTSDTLETTQQSVLAGIGAVGDAAATQGSTGSLSAKLRTVTSQLNTIATTGIPITGTVTVGSHAVTNAGTFATQAAQSGTWTVQPGNTANTTPWLFNLGTAQALSLSNTATNTENTYNVLNNLYNARSIDIEDDATPANYLGPQPMLRCESSGAINAIDDNDVGSAYRDCTYGDLFVGPRLTAAAHGTNPTAVAAGASARTLANRAGVPFVMGGHPNTITKTATIVAADGAQTGTALVTVSAGTKIVVTRANLRCSADNSVKPDFRLAFDTDSTLTAASTTGVTGEIDAAYDVIAGGGFSGGAGAGILGVGADDEDLRYSLGAPTSGACTVSVSYYTIES